MLAVGIGKDAKREELRLMTTTDDSVYMMQSFDALLRKVKNFAKTACEGERKDSIDCLSLSMTSQFSWQRSVKMFYLTH